MIRAKDARIAALEAEVERLRERERLLIAKIADPETGLYRERADLQDAATAATERAQAAEQDARRYRWLRDVEQVGELNLYISDWRGSCYTGAEADAAIDAALAAPQGEP